MSKTFKISVTTPDQLVFSNDVDMAIIPGAEGEMGILADHSPLITTLKSGVVNLKYVSNESQDRVFVESGFAEVKDNECAILATKAYDLSKVTQAEIKEKIELAKVRLNTADTEFDKKIAEDELKLNQDIISFL